jgi:hypothetical protein
MTQTRAAVADGPFYLQKQKLFRRELTRESLGYVPYVKLPGTFYRSVCTRPRNVEVTDKWLWSSSAIYPIGSIRINPYAIGFIILLRRNVVEASATLLHDEHLKLSLGGQIIVPKWANLASRSPLEGTSICRLAHCPDASTSCRLLSDQRWPHVFSLSRCLPSKSKGYRLWYAVAKIDGKFLPFCNTMSFHMAGRSWTEVNIISSS